MRSLVLVLAAVAALAAPAQAQSFDQPQLDALLAPVALYPDELVNHILVAAAYPDQVSDAARGSPAQPHWHPSVAALAPYPEILQRMAESPQWMRELSEAFIYQQASVMQTIQALRSRAQAYGHLEPQREVVYVRYYDPLVVYGAWWWPAHRPHFWRPWHSHRVFIRHNHHHQSHGSHHKHVDRHPALPAPRIVHTPKRHHGSHVKAPVRVPESRRHPIISSTPQISHRQWRSPSHSRAPSHSPSQSHSPQRSGGIRHHKQRR